MLPLELLINRKITIDLPQGKIQVPELTTKQYLEMIEIDKLEGAEMHKRRISFVGEILQLNIEKVEVLVDELPYSLVNAIWANLVEFTFTIMSDPN